VIVTIHGSDLLGERLSGPVRRVFAGIGVLASRAAAKRADGIVTVATHLAQVLPTRVDRAKVRVIPCGIDLNLFKPMDPVQCRRELGWNEDVFHVLFAVSGDPVKRPALAHSAVAALAELGVKAQIHEMRHVPYNRVPTWINAAHALLLTSLHEGSPTIVKESLACNVPVVSTDVGDVRERIHGVSGCAVIDDNPQALAHALRAACLARNRSDGRSRVEELSLSRTAGRLKDFYTEVIAARDRSSTAARRPIRST
jgi:glycosyltransferase involved in cell wall biosynthesis